MINLGRIRNQLLKFRIGADGVLLLLSRRGCKPQRSYGGEAEWLGDEILVPLLIDAAELSALCSLPEGAARDQAVELFAQQRPNGTNSIAGLTLYLAAVETAFWQALSPEGKPIGGASFETLCQQLASRNGNGKNGSKHAKGQDLAGRWEDACGLSQTLLERRGIYVGRDDRFAGADQTLLAELQSDLRDLAQAGPATRNALLDFTPGPTRNELLACLIFQAAAAGIERSGLERYLPLMLEEANIQERNGRIPRRQLDQRTMGSLVDWARRVANLSRWNNADERIRAYLQPSRKGHDRLGRKLPDSPAELPAAVG